MKLQIFNCMEKHDYNNGMAWHIMNNGSVKVSAVS